MGKVTTNFKCIGHCKKEFNVSEWECVPGIKHEVEPQTFYILDAPVLAEKDKMGKAFRDSRTTVLNCPPERNVKGENGEMIRIPGGSVIFSRGTFTTSDPELVFWLEKHGFRETTKERWLEVYFSPLEKQQLKEIDLHNREKEANRKLKEANDLLDKARAQTQSSQARKTA